MKKRSPLRVLVRLLALVKPLAGRMALAVTAGTLAYLAVQFIPVLGGYAMLRALGKASPLSLSALWVCLPLLALLRAVLRYIEQHTNHYIAFTLLAIIRDKVFRALRRLCPAKLEGRDKGDLISLITGDVELLEVFYAHTISPICIAVLSEAVMCLYIGSFHPALGLLALASFLAVGVLLPLIVFKISGDVGSAVRGRAAALAAHVLENIRGLDETVQYRCGQGRLAGMNEKTAALSRAQSRLNRLTGLNLALAGTLILVSDVAMVLLAGALYHAGRVGFEGFLLPVLALMSSFGPVSALAGLGSTLQNTVASGGRVLDILEETPETEEITGCPPVAFHGAACEGVSFAYGGEQVLQSFSMAFPENRVVGVVGKSGSGKSTLLKLLMRFWRVQQGQVRISDTDIERVNTRSLRDMESYMTQETHLFKDTVANNIRIARLDASQQEIEAACKKAALHDFIMTLPQGYETPVGELGSTLSGGERQRIGLARAFLHGAPFLLLDEPTSNLDSLNEAVILKSLRREAQGKTVVLVSHRASTVRIADEVHSVENGRVS